jgi:hypothetical protein
MSIKNLECQLAQAQIGRYIAGDRISVAAVTQLEEHIAECDDCRAVLIERKQALLAMLPAEVKAPKRGPILTAVVQTTAQEKLQEAIEQKAPKPARTRKKAVTAETTATPKKRTRKKAVEPVEEAPEPTIKAAPSLEDIFGPRPEPKPAPAPAPEEKVEEKPQPKIGQLKNSPFWKPFTYSAALAILLIVMSFISKNPTGLLGQRADQAIASTPPAMAAAPAVASSTPAEPEPTPEDVPVEPAAAAVPPVENEPATEAAPVATPEAATPTEPVPVSETKPVVENKPAATPQKPAARTSNRRRPVTQPRASQPRSNQGNPYGSIRVYDESGAPKQPAGGQQP